MQKQEILKILPERILPWYRENARDLPWRKTRDPYAIWVSEIMLQQTRVETVLAYWERFVKALPDISSLASCPGDILHKYWEGLGYYRRADNMKKAACIIMEEFGGVFPSSYEDILSLPGIGSYTAGAVSSICFDEKRPAVDGNVLRVLSRLTEDPSPVDRSATVRMWEQELLGIYPDTGCGMFTQSLMELGATVCLPNGLPGCGICPMRDLCLAKKEGSFLSFPVREEKKAKRQEDLTVFLFDHDGKTAVRLRTEQGLLQGLWEFPNVTGIRTEQEAVEEAERMGVTVTAVERQINRTHLFTHVIWKMRCFVVRCANETPDFSWCTHSELEETYAIPSAFRKLLD
ncbi:MAG: A/G-specific adenine glycosylase [Clostridia bacterium]|nr:A/G-specific adenine glycosylase [Clostridia bacterium]